MSLRGNYRRNTSLLSCLLILCCTNAVLAKKKPPIHPINLNSASAAELQQVPGIGPSTANKILEMRKSYGAFKSVDDLLAIKGIGPKAAGKDAEVSDRWEVSAKQKGVHERTNGAGTGEVAARKNGCRETAGEKATLPRNHLRRTTRSRRSAVASRLEEGFIAQKACDGKPYLTSQTLSGMTVVVGKDDRLEAWLNWRTASEGGPYRIEPERSFDLVQRSARPMGGLTGAGGWAWAWRVAGEPGRRCGCRSLRGRQLS